MTDQTQKLPKEESEYDERVARTATWVGFGAVLVLVGLSAYATLVDRGSSVAVVGWAAFVAMGTGILLGTRQRGRGPVAFVWGYGLAGGAIITSAALFLLPQATSYDPQAAGAGIALGLGGGYAGHTIGHRLSHLDLPIDRTTAQITAHAIAAGAVIGVVYAANPDLSIVLGLAIASHKAPAGYAAARRLSLADRPARPLLLPAAALGIVALLARLSGLSLTPAAEGVLFGFATGVFIHLGMDFLPECEVGGEIHELGNADATQMDHTMLDRLRVHAVGSLAVGGSIVYAAWLIV